MRVRATPGELEAFTEITLITDLRPSLATGVVDFINPDVSDKATPSARTSLFATGKVGDYLFIGAYNSDHALNQTAEGPSSLGQDNANFDPTLPANRRLRGVCPSGTNTVH